MSTTGNCRTEGHDWKAIGSVYAKCERCGKSKRSSTPVKVKRVVPDTGELIEQTVPVTRFRRPREERIPERFRDRVLAGERPGLVFPGDEDCPVEAGEEIHLTENVSVLINRITKTKGGDHRVRYSVRDFRPTLLRRTPKMFEPPELDRYGDPIPHTKEAIEAATIDGNYTQDPRQAVPSSAPEIDVEYRRVLSVRKRKAEMDKEPSEEIRRKRERAIRDELRSTLKGLDPNAAAALLAQIEGLCRQAKDASAVAV